MTSTLTGFLTPSPVCCCCREIDATYLLGERVIKQGDSGDFMFVIESGSLECLISKDGAEEVVRSGANQILQTKFREMLYQAAVIFRQFSFRLPKSARFDISEVSDISQKKILR